MPSLAMQILEVDGAALVPARVCTSEADDVPAPLIQLNSVQMVRTKTRRGCVTDVWTMEYLIYHACG